MHKIHCIFITLNIFQINISNRMKYLHFIEVNKYSNKVAKIPIQLLQNNLTSTIVFNNINQWMILLDHLSIDISIKDGDTKFNPLTTQEFHRNQLSLFGMSSLICTILLYFSIKLSLIRYSILLNPTFRRLWNDACPSYAPVLYLALWKCQTSQYCHVSINICKWINYIRYYVSLQTSYTQEIKDAIITSLHDRSCGWRVTELSVQDTIITSVGPAIVI